MTSSKTKRMASVAALSAALMLGGVAAAQAGGDAAAPEPCVHGKGKGMGTGAPGNDKGNGAERGWPHGCKPKKEKDDSENEAKDKKDKKDKEGKEQDDDAPGGGGTETPAGGTETPPGGTETPAGGTETPAVNVDGSIDIDLPSLPGPAVNDVENLLLGILTPAVQNAAGAALQTAGQATELVTNDVAAVAGLLEGAGAVGVGAGPAEAAVTIPLSGVVSVAGGTTRAVTGIVAGMGFAV